MLRNLLAAPYPLADAGLEKAVGEETDDILRLADERFKGPAIAWGCFAHLVEPYSPSVLP